MATIDDAAKFGDVPMEVQIELGRLRMKLRDILDFRTGSLLGTKRLATDGVDVRVAGVRVGSARIVLSDNRVAVRVTSIDAAMPAAAPRAAAAGAGKKA